MLKFLQDANNEDTKAIAIPQVFSENSPAKNLENKTKNIRRMFGE